MNPEVRNWNIKKTIINHTSLHFDAILNFFKLSGVVVVVCLGVVAAEVGKLAVVVVTSYTLLIITSYTLLIITSYKLQATSYKLPVTSYQLQVTSY
jgi:hypothetical protein